MSVPPPIAVVADDPEERSMAALAHGSIALNFFVPGLGIIAALAVWLTQRERSAYAARQGLQASIYQIMWMMIPVCALIMGVLAAIGGVFSAALFDMRPAMLLMMVLVFGLMAVVAFVVIGLLYGLVAAYETYRGRDFNYWLLGKMIH
jgi:uncharacterized Tic20 family protein